MSFMTAPQTEYTGLGLYTVAPMAANMSPSIAPMSNYGSATQPQQVGLGISLNSNSPSGTPTVGNPMAISQSSNMASSHSPIIPVVLALAVSVVGLHYVFYRKEKTI